VYTYDAQGNKLTETKTGDSPHVIRWEYDDQGRVIFVAQTGTSPYEKTYEYDAYGNLIRISSTNSYTAVRDYTYTAIAVTPEAAARLLAQQEEIFRHLNGEVLSIN
jgi:YD repeat-containing protein